MSKNEAYKNRIDDLFSNGEPPQSEPVEGLHPLESETTPSRVCHLILPPKIRHPKISHKSRVLAALVGKNISTPLTAQSGLVLVLIKKKSYP